MQIPCKRPTGYKDKDLGTKGQCDQEDEGGPAPYEIVSKCRWHAPE